MFASINKDVSVVILPVTLNNESTIPTCSPRPVDLIYSAVPDKHCYLYCIPVLFVLRASLCGSVHGSPEGTIKMQAIIMIICNCALTVLNITLSRSCRTLKLSEDCKASHHSEGID